MPARRVSYNRSSVFVGSEICVQSVAVCKVKQVVRLEGLFERTTVFKHSS